MTVKELKKYLNLYSDETKVIIRMPSGNDYKIREEMVDKQTLNDKARENCKIYIK